MKGNDLCLLCPRSVMIWFCLKLKILMLLWREHVFQRGVTWAWSCSCHLTKETPSKLMLQHVHLRFRVLQPLIFSKNITVFLAYHCNSYQDLLASTPLLYFNTSQTWKAGGMGICIITGNPVGMCPFISMSHREIWLPHNYLWGHKGALV